jgi:hypothetical protein
VYWMPPGISQYDMSRTELKVLTVVHAVEGELSMLRDSLGSTMTMSTCSGEEIEDLEEGAKRALILVTALALSLWMPRRSSFATQRGSYGSAEEIMVVMMAVVGVVGRGVLAKRISSWPRQDDTA